MQIPHPALGQDFTPSPTPRRAQPAQAYEPEVPVKVRQWIGPALASPDLVLEAQPPAQPLCCVIVERPIRLADGAYLEVVRPAAQRAVKTYAAHERGIFEDLADKRAKHDDAGRPRPNPKYQGRGQAEAGRTGVFPCTPMPGSAPGRFPSALPWSPRLGGRFAPTSVAMPVSATTA